MSRYWNRILIDKLFSNTSKPNIKYKLHTRIGRFYFYFKKEEDSNVSGKLIFFPNENFIDIKKE